ncbi:hypothetical protein ACTVNK_02390 [Serratia nevei]
MQHTDLLMAGCGTSNLAMGAHLKSVLKTTISDLPSFPHHDILFNVSVLPFD